eukprot:3558317-Rhodomonas_salina.1
MSQSPCTRETHTHTYAELSTERRVAGRLGASHCGIAWHCTWHRNGTEGRIAYSVRARQIWHGKDANRVAAAHSSSRYSIAYSVGS